MELTSPPTRVHPTAVVHPEASIGGETEIGPYAVIDAGAAVGARCSIGAHARIHGCCAIGEGCEVRTGAVLGGPPQIRGHRGTGGGVRIGDDCVIGEHATVHRASEPSQVTTLGRDVLLMTGAHVAHDCRVDTGVTISNGALLAGFVEIHPRAFVSGNVVVHQFTRIGELSMVGGGAEIGRDVPPYLLVAGRSLAYGINAVGLRRAGFSEEQRRALRRAYQLLYRSGQNLSQAVSVLETWPETPELRTLLAFIRGTTRGLCVSPSRRRASI